MPRVFDPKVPGWDWQPDKCPCDLQFMEWLVDNERPGGSVFHMGTGMHHNIGLTCSEMGLACTGVTVSRDELNNAPFSHQYQIVYGDIYFLDTRLLPSYTTMTLFHLGEMVETFGTIHEPAVRGLMSKVVKNGHVLFYTKSSAWDRTKETVLDWEKQGILKDLKIYKDLAVYRV